MIRLFAIALLTAAAGVMIGCNGGRPTEDIPVKASNDPLEQPRAALRRYAEGQPIGSEATSFDYMVNEVRKTDPARAEVLKAGLDDIQKNPAQRQPKAKALLEKLKPSMK